MNSKPGRHFGLQHTIRPPGLFVPSVDGTITPKSRDEEASMKDPFPQTSLVIRLMLPVFLFQLVPVRAHESTRAAFLKRHNVAALARPVGTGALTGHEVCNLKVTLTEEGSGAALPGLIRVTAEGREEALELPGLFHRARGWHTLPPSAELAVPRAKLRIEALHGLETEKTTAAVDLSGKEREEIGLPLRRIYDPRARGLKSGNTHLHLSNITYRDAERYLREVPLGDGLDLLFVSYLRRMPDEARYTTNGFNRSDLTRLSGGGIAFGWGQEHRHNFGRGEQGFGHVMLLNLLKLIRPVSIGPGIMGAGTDGRPLQMGIVEAREDGGTVIWCHNAYGHEDIPNWMAGLVDAQNIFDGGSLSDYGETFYRYLNVGVKVPFSTGTDWFIYDFSRVYVPMNGPVTEREWLEVLSQGRSYITNGPFLELEVGGRRPGGTVSLAEGETVRIRGRGVGRLDFKALELIVNGRVVHTVPSRASGAHFVAGLDFALEDAGPGWVALRIPGELPDNELARSLFAHTSPVYLELDGRSVFQPDVARSLLAEMEKSLDTIRSRASFSGSPEREDVLRVYRKGIQILRLRLAGFSGS